MGRAPTCDENGLKKGPWTPEEDQKLIQHIRKHGHGSWRALPKLAGLNRCGKSCRLRWTNYLRPDIKRGKFSAEEEETILNLHSILGNKWSAIASHLSGRTDNEIKNFWNTHLKKKLVQMDCDPITRRQRTDFFSGSLPQLVALANLGELFDGLPWDGCAAGLQAVQAAKLGYLLQSAKAMANSWSSNCRGTMEASDLEAMNLLSSQMVSAFPAIPRPDRVNQPSSFLCEPPTNQEFYAMAGPALFAFPRSPLPPNNDASVINQGDGYSISSYSGNGSDSLWPDLLLDDQFMAGFD